jgi:hypothetical protein
MNYRRKGGYLSIMAKALFAIAALILSLCGSSRAAETSTAPITQGLATLQSNKGRIYVFRMIRSFGAHIDDFLTIDGATVQRITAGNALYCDVDPGDYLLGLSRHKTRPLKVSVTAGQEQYICVTLHHGDGISPRQGAPSSDQSFDMRLLEPAYGAQRIREYHLTQADCHH